MSGGRLGDQRVVIHGAGTAGIGIAEQLAAAIGDDGATDGRAAIWALSSRGLLRTSDEHLRDFQRPFARAEGEVSSFARDSDGRIGLAEVVRQVRPTVLIGTSGQPGSFSEDVVRAMAAHCERPIIMPLSNPTSLSEADPADLLAWTEGRALVATGSPFPPAVVRNETFAIAQANNALVFPGLGLGAIVSRASRITPGMLRAAAAAVAGELDPTRPGAPLLPPVDTLQHPYRQTEKVRRSLPVTSTSLPPSATSGPTSARGANAAGVARSPKPPGPFSRLLRPPAGSMNEPRGVRPMQPHVPRRQPRVPGTTAFGCRSERGGARISGSAR